MGQAGGRGWSAGTAGAAGIVLVSEPREGAATGEGLSRAHLKQRFVTNSGLIAAARIVTACLSLVTIPILISRLGVAGYGTWEALLAFASLTTLFQAAIGGALVWRISEAFGQGDTSAIRRAVRLGAGASWAIFVLLWPLSWLLRDSVVKLLGVAPESRQVASDLFPLVAGLVLLGGLSQTLEAVVNGCQRSGLVNVIVAGAQILNYAVVIVVTVLGGGLWSLAAGQAVGFVSRLAGAWIAARVAFGAVSLVPVMPNSSDWSMARYSGFATVGSVAAVLRDQTDKVILAALASPAWVAYYGMAARLNSLVLEIIGFFYLPILTAAGALKAMGDWEAVRRLYARMMAIVSILTGLVVIVVAGLADRLIVLWVGHPIPEVTTLLWLLIGGAASAAMLTGPGTAICRGCGRVEIETAYLAFNLVLNVVLTVSLVLLIGPIGTAVATGVTWAVASILFLVVLHRALDLPVDASRRAGAMALLAAGVAAALYWTSAAWGPDQGRRDAFVSIVLLGSGGGLVYLALATVFRLVPVREAYGSVRALLRSAA
jgi:O-antigen/teichoic acid export membrane protein